MKTIVCAGVAAAILAGPASARELEDILKDRGVITEEEAAESRKTSTPKGTALNLSWDKGLRANSPDGKFKLKFGGRIQSDWAIFDADDDIEEFFADDEGNPQEFGAGTEFRRARLYVSGEVYGNVIFKAQYDFAGGDADFKDVYLGLKKMGLLGSVKVGHYKEPFSLNELTSSKYNPFMERALPNVFAPSRNSGIGFQNAAMNDRLTYALGVYRDVDDFGFGFGEDDDYNFTGRITGTPIYADDGRRLVHLGVAYSYQMREGGVRYRQRPSAHLSPVRFVDTGTIDADSVNLLGLEAAGVLGPVSVQGEYVPTWVDASEAGDPSFQGYYVLATYFLTGESRTYKGAAGTFSRVKPKSNFDGKGGAGAWEVGIRYAALDLEDSGIDGGEMWDLTAGVNWYLNPNVRVMVNYVFADLDQVGEANIFQSRFQIDF